MRTKIIRALSAIIKVLAAGAAATAYLNPEMLPAKYMLPALIILGGVSASKDFLMTLCDLLDDGKVNGSYKLPLVAVLLCCVVLGSGCAGTRLTREELVQDGLNVAAGAAMGYVAAGKAGAVEGATTAAVTDLRRLSTAGAKQPVGVVTEQRTKIQ